MSSVEALSETITSQSAYFCLRTEVNAYFSNFKRFLVGMTMENFMTISRFHVDCMHGILLKCFRIFPVSRQMAHTAHVITNRPFWWPIVYYSCSEKTYESKTPW